MPRGTHPNSLANLKNNPHRFNSETASKAGKKGAPISNAVQKQQKTIRELAKIVGEAAVDNPKLVKQLASLGITEGDATNNALILAAIFQAAIHGDMKAIEKWMKMIGQEESTDKKTDGQLEDIIDSLREPYDIHAEAAAIISGLADESAETD